MAQGEDDRAGGQRDRARPGRDPAEIDPGVVDLPDVAEARVAQRHVPHPERGEAQLLGPAGQAFLVAHRRPVARERLDREEDAERQSARREHPPEAVRLTLADRGVSGRHAITPVFPGRLDPSRRERVPTPRRRASSRPRHVRNVQPWNGPSSQRLRRAGSAREESESIDFITFLRKTLGIGYREAAGVVATGNPQSRPLPCDILSGSNRSTDILAQRASVAAMRQRRRISTAFPRARPLARGGRSRFDSPQDGFDRRSFGRVLELLNTVRGISIAMPDAFPSRSLIPSPPADGALLYHGRSRALLLPDARLPPFGRRGAGNLSVQPRSERGHIVRAGRRRSAFEVEWRQSLSEPALCRSIRHNGL